MQGRGEMRGDQELTPLPSVLLRREGSEIQVKRLGTLMPSWNGMAGSFSKNKDALAESSAILLLEICFKESLVRYIRRHGGDHL